PPTVGPPAVSLPSSRPAPPTGAPTSGAACHITPPAAARLRAGAKLILIAAADSATALDGAGPAVDESAIVARGEAGRRPERTLLLGWNARSGTVLEQLDQYVAPGSITDVVTDH